MCNWFPLVNVGKTTLLNHVVILTFFEVDISSLLERPSSCKVNERPPALKQSSSWHHRPLYYPPQSGKETFSSPYLRLRFRRVSYLRRFATSKSSLLLSQNLGICQEDLQVRTSRITESSSYSLSFEGLSERTDQLLELKGSSPYKTHLAY